MLLAILFVSVSMIGVLGYYMFIRSFKSNVLVFDKGSFNNSRFLVCPKCGQAQARNGGYQECCRTRL
ncbi:hypothetical protein P6P90_01695 [Ectobacillus antri]|jgi:hypothetical protein|uniref:Uncharacterized protein n=1 Tax=Ectobacillus antri TaxID=2486280 RepID=A0ABT6H0L0_9BACI|nr:hypothetical protein [Ectobacillus antri]MDG4656038.1 hypothetical protein [Ectobacillus antri]MDG5752713.1 hypothetical protein [Ectobacillus antri]